ncbi:hypothetical protein ACHAPF_007274 [Botrytis cinerea]
MFSDSDSDSDSDCDDDDYDDAIDDNDEFQPVIKDHGEEDLAICDLMEGFCKMKEVGNLEDGKSKISGMNGG